ncbi:related to 24-dehydrocholesterol reductase precursor [Lecanosticta acicola]|uniref:Delta(24)-sterol reductase n=1 Tax=Lecanosticta acicola TaxID=111012 RepID=A0AAI9EDG7_9PEZI|nr:related to 24-dehydrocholesterol reductase precursor [Lecanosticta acicola]
MEVHQDAVKAIASRVASFYDRKVPFRLYHGSTNTTQQRKVDLNKAIDTSKLNHVLAVDTERMTCLVEPNVAMDELVDAVLPYGVLPPVVMEFPVTVGGGFAGTAGESSGFKYGFFDCIVNWIEIVLPNGEIVKASKTEREDLFHGAAGSFGTLGVTTLLELQLIPAKKYVELTYHPVRSVSEAMSKMDVVTNDSSNDYVDGIQYSMTKGVIVSGRLTDTIAPGQKLQRFSRAQDPWFYIHVDRTTNNGFEEITEVTPVKDYLFRYDRGAFWTGKYAFQYFLTPFNRITRWALDYFMHTRVMYHALHASGHASKYIVQDLLLPRSGVEEFIQFVNDRFGFWPLWLCPLKRGQEVSLHPRLPEEEVGDGKSVSFINVGVWGPGSTDFAKFVQQNRQLEGKLRALGGIKWLYAQAFYTEDEFWSIYDKEWYDALREKYHATHLPTVWQKVRVDLSRVNQGKDSWSGWLRSAVWGIWPVSGIYGVVKTLLGREYLLAK